MTFDEEGRLHVTPKEVHDLSLKNPQRLINEVLIPGTAIAFPTHRSYNDFLQYFADTLSVHPRNICLKGSTKVGFSIAPRPQSLIDIYLMWRNWRASSEMLRLECPLVKLNRYRVHNRKTLGDFSPREEKYRRKLSTIAVILW